MDVCSLARPAAEIITRARCSRLLPITTVRGHKTTARTKRSLKIAPHDDFLPDRSGASAMAQDHIIYNPPASEASPLHTPFIFLPLNDPRRSALVRMRINNAALIPNSQAATVKSEADLPPAMKYTRRLAKYNLTAEDMQEMKRLRDADPIKWDVKALSEKFNCSPIIVSIAAPASAEHAEWREKKMERQRARWGPIKTKAAEDRRRRSEMLYRGEL